MNGNRAFIPFLCPGMNAIFPLTPYMNPIHPSKVHLRLCFPHGNLPHHPQSTVIFLSLNSNNTHCICCALIMDIICFMSIAFVSSTGFKAPLSQRIMPLYPLRDSVAFCIWLVFPQLECKLLQGGNQVLWIFSLCTPNSAQCLTHSKYLVNKSLINI